MKSSSYPIEFEGYASDADGDHYFTATARIFEGEVDGIEHDQDWLTKEQEDDLLEQAESALAEHINESREFDRAMAREDRAEAHHYW